MKKRIGFLWITLFLLVLSAGCGKAAALPEWLPEGCQDWQPNRLSVDIFINGSESETQAMCTLVLPDGSARTYRYNLRDGLREEAAKEIRTADGRTVDQVLTVFENLAQWIEETMPPERLEVGIGYSYLVYNQSTLEAIQKVQQEKIDKGETGYYYTYSLSTGKVTELTAPFEGSGNGCELVSLGFYSGYHMVDVFWVD